MTKVVSFGGLALSTGNYGSSKLMYSYTVPPLQVVSTPRGGGFGRITAIDRVADYRPSVLQVQINSNWSTAYRALMAALDTSTSVKALVISDDNGSNERYLMCAVQQVTQIPGGAGYQYAAVMVVDDDQYWRAVTPATDAWSITASDQTNVVANAGDLDAYPTYTFTPTDEKSTGAVYVKPYSVGYQGAVAYEQMPVRLNLNTDTLIHDSEKIDDETNLAVYVNGKEVRRWFSDWDDANTGIWLNMDFGPGHVGAYSGFNSATNTAMGSGDDVENVVLSSDITNWPSAGVFKIGTTEAFVYDGVDRAFKTLLNVRRAYGFNAAAHAVGDAVVFVQHDVEVVYGDGVTAATSFPDDTYPDGTIVPYDDRKPIIDLDASTNFSWVYDQAFNEVFEDDQAEFLPRTARWRHGRQTANVSYPLGLPPSSSLICEVIGIQIDAPRRQRQTGNWFLPLPRGLTEVEYEAFGRWIRSEGVTGSAADLWQARLWSGTWNILNPIVTFGVPAEDEGEFSFTGEYSGTADAEASAGHVLTLDLAGQGQLIIQISSLTLTFESSSSFVSNGVEFEAYELNGRLTNMTTGESITVQLPMVIDEPLTIDTANRTVTYQDTNQYQAFKRDNFRLPWLRLAPGNNTLKWTETGVTGLDIDIEFTERYY